MNKIIKYGLYGVGLLASAYIGFEAKTFMDGLGKYNCGYHKTVTKSKTNSSMSYDAIQDVTSFTANGKCTLDQILNRNKDMKK